MAYTSHNPHTISLLHQVGAGVKVIAGGLSIDTHHLQCHLPQQHHCPCATPRDGSRWVWNWQSQVQQVISPKVSYTHTQKHNYTSMYTQRTRSTITINDNILSFLTTHHASCLGFTTLLASYSQYLMRMSDEPIHSLPVSERRAMWRELVETTISTTQATGSFHSGYWRIVIVMLALCKSLVVVFVLLIYFWF